MPKRSTQFLSLITATLMSAGAFAQSVEVALVDNLDGDLSTYCFDIMGSGENADPSRGLQAHTCYSYRGALGIDQIFEASGVAEGRFFMPEFDVCATLSEAAVGATLGLATCDGSAAQQISMRESGTIGPAAVPSLCLTAGEETRLGRGGTSRHQIKSLSLQLCSAEAAASQTWRLRESAD